MALHFIVLTALARAGWLWAALFVAAVVLDGATLFARPGLARGGRGRIDDRRHGRLASHHIAQTRRSELGRAALSSAAHAVLSAFYLHVGEETLTGFDDKIAKISGKPWPDDDFLLLIGLAGPVVWVFAAWSLWHRQALGNFVFWFLVVGMILGEATHLVDFPVRLMAIEGHGYA